MLDSPLEEIKSRLDVADVISGYIQLTPAGTNFKAKCPFHQEKTPSFMVSREKQIWHCFGCGAGGDVFTFVMKMEGLEFPEALRLLADKAGVKLRPRDPALTNQRTRLLDLTKLAANYFHQVLLTAQKAAGARDYLKDRQVSQPTIVDFKLGYAPDFMDGLSQFLLKRGYQPAEIVLAGLAIKRDNGQLIDRFRDRLMFPLCDVHSNVVGFGGRILQANSQLAKYINTPQTLIYDKSRVVFALDKAKQAIREQKAAVVVEGYMDALTSHQAGITNVVASAGTALTLEQIKLLQRYTNNLILAFDADLAGDSAAARGIGLALQQGLAVKVISLPAGNKDPDECIRQNPDQWRQAIASARSIMDYYFEKVLAQFDLKQAEGRGQAAQTLLAVIAKLADRVQQSYHLHRLAEILETPDNILFEQLDALLKKQSTEPIRRGEPAPVVGATKNRCLLLSERLLAAALKFPQHLEYVVSHLPPDILTGQPNQALYQSIIICYTNNVWPVDKPLTEVFCQKLTDQIEPTQRDYVNVLTLLADKDFIDFSPTAIQEEILQMIQYLKDNFLTQQRRILARQMQQAEKNGQQAEVDELAKQFNQLINNK